MAHLQEAVDLLVSGGVLARIQEESQAAREAKRAELLAQIPAAEKVATERCEAYAKLQVELEARVALLEADLATARSQLLKHGSDYGTANAGRRNVETMRSELRKLSDPRIEEACRELRNLEGNIRWAFLSSERRTKRLGGGYNVSVESNALQCADVAADLRAELAELEALKEAPRPDDLAALLASKLARAKQGVDKLGGSRS